MSSGTIGHGATLGYSAGAGGPYTDFSEAVSIAKGSQKADKVDFTHLTSTSRRKEFKLGLIDSGEVKVTTNTLFDAARTAMIAARDAGSLLYWRYRAYDTTTSPATLQATETFSAYVSEFDDGTIEASTPKRTTMTLVVTGARTEV